MTTRRERYQSEHGVTTADDPDRMIWYSVGCGYWTDAWDLVAAAPGVPRCPSCGAPGMQTTAADWDGGVAAYDKEHPGYAALIADAKEKCLGRGGFKKEVEARGLA